MNRENAVQCRSLTHYEEQSDPPRRMDATAPGEPPLKRLHCRECGAPAPQYFAAGVAAYVCERHAERELDELGFFAGSPS